MPVKEILLLGHPKLYKISELVQKDEIARLRDVANDLHDTLMDFKKRYGKGRAISAPQLGVMKRLIYMNITGPVIIINPEWLDLSEERLELWDDCMCFPHLLVKVQRHKKCRLRFLNQNWEEEVWELEDDLSELLQHEVDHLDGILATQRVIDNQSFAWK